MPNAKLNEGWVLKKVVMCPPQKEYFNIDETEKHNIRQRSDPERAIEQHRRLRELLRNNGVEVIELPELEGHPNSIFTMDTSLSLGTSFIQLRMGLETRRGEEQWMANVLLYMNLEKIGEVKSPGTAEGGDLIPAYPYFFIGLSSRTNAEGARQIKRIVEKYGYEARMVPVPKKHLHLGGAMTIIEDNNVLACESIPEKYLAGFDVIRIKCESFISGNVINLGSRRVIAESKNIETIEILRDYGFNVQTVDLSEFVKGSGGPSCLILPLRREESIFE